MSKLKFKKESADFEMGEEKKIKHTPNPSSRGESEEESQRVSPFSKGKTCPPLAEGGFKEDEDKTPLPPFGKGGREAPSFMKAGTDQNKLDHPLIVKACEWLITFSFALIFLGAPLFFTGLTLQGMNFEKQMFFYAALLIGFFAWILKAILEGKILIKRTPLDIPIIVFIIAALASSFFSVNRWASFMGAFGLPAKSFISVLAFAFFYWLLISNINKKRLKVILTALAVSIGLVSFFSILNFFNVNIIGALLGLFGMHPAWTKVLTENAGFNTIGLLSNLQIFASAGILIMLGIMGGTQHTPNPSSRGELAKERLDSSPLQEGTGVCKSGAGISKLVKNILLYIILLMLFLIIIVLGNFTSLIGLLIGLGVIIILAMAHLVDVDKKVFAVSSLLFALTLVYIIIGKPPITLRDLPQEVGLTRQISWQISKDTFREKYLLGTGLGNFEHSFNRFKPVAFNNNALWNTRFSEATGIFYEAIATVGGIGAAAMILLILTFLGVCFYFVLYKRDGEEVKVSPFSKGEKGGFKEDEDKTPLPPFGKGGERAPTLGKGESASLSGDGGNVPFIFVAFFAASIALGIDNILYLTGGAMLIFTIIIAALTMSIIAIHKKEYFKDLTLSYTVKPEYALALSFVFVCLSCGMILIFVALGKVYMADVYARSALSSNTEEMAVYKLNQAIILSPYQYMYYEKLGDLLARVGDKEIKSEKGDMEKVQSLFVNALNSHKKAVSLSPENAFSWENLGVLSESIVQYDPTLLNDAEASYKKAQELDPNNPALRMRLGVVKEAKGDIAFASIKQQNSQSADKQEKVDEATKKNAEEAGKKLYTEALENFNKAIELKSNLTSGYDGVARIKEKTGNLDEAINYMAASYQLNRKNGFYSFNLGRLFFNRAVIRRNGKQSNVATSTEITSPPPSPKGEGETSPPPSPKGEGETSPSANTTDKQSSSKGEEERVKSDLKNAEALFKQAVQLQDKYVDALYSLGLLYEHQGMKTEAKEYYKKTLDALPKNSEARKAIEERIGSL